MTTQKNNFYKTFILLIAAILILIHGALLVPSTMGESSLAEHLPLLQDAVVGAVGFVSGLMLLFVGIKLPAAVKAPAPAIRKTAEVKAPVKPVVPEVKPGFEAVALMSLMQKKGRFIDFLMEDVTRFEDSQVAAAARVVHQGCNEVLKNSFDIESVHQGTEGSEIELNPGFDSEQYRLSGNLEEGAISFKGRLLHRGWKVSKVNLPKALKSTQGLPVITPAEIEVK